MYATASFAKSASYAQTASLVNYPVFNTVFPQITAGSLYAQGYALNNAFIGENTYFDGAWKYRDTGYAELLNFYNGEAQFRIFNLGAANSALTASGAQSQLKVHFDGNVAIGGVMNTNSGDYTGAAILVNSSSIQLNVPVTASIISASTHLSSSKGYFANNTHVNGTFTALVKSFLIDHPTKKGKKLQYTSVESPYNGVQLSGKETMTSRVCRVDLPDYFNSLTREEGINIQLTNYQHGKLLYVNEINHALNFFTVTTDSPDPLGCEFFWMVTAVRKDVPELVTEV